jgi:hypothetical protein
LLFLPSVASADSFSASFVGTGLGAGVKGSYAGGSFNVFAGQIEWSTGLDSFLSFCLQLDSPLQTTQQFESSVPGHISASDHASISYLVTKNFSTVTTNWMAAGLQLAIWNILYDSDSLASAGAFYSATSNATYFADGFLADLAHQQTLTGSAVFLNSVPGTRGQDQVTVPEPATWLLLGGAIAALSVRRRRAPRI